MGLENFKKGLIDRITDIQEVLRVLDRHLVSTGPVYMELKLLQSRFSDLRKDKNAGVIGTYDDVSQQFSKLRLALMELINAVTPESMKKKKDFRLLVICKNDDDKTYMKNYFSALPLEADVFEATNYIDPDNYALIVFDAHSIGVLAKKEMEEKLPPADKNHIDLLNQYLEKAPKWLVYYGEYNYILNNHRDTTNAANNKFSLYARVKEMRDFIEGYQVGRIK